MKFSTYGDIIFYALTHVSVGVLCVVFFPFPDDNLSKYKWIFTSLGMCKGAIS